MVNKKKALLAHEQGLGKTVTSIACFEKLKELNKAKTCLIIGQASYLFQWHNAIERFSDEPDTYTVVSYNHFRAHSDELSPPSVMVCDEAQEFANNKSKTAKLVKQYNLQHDPTYRWALTGTAIRNKLENLYSIMYWVDKYFFVPWPLFEKKHVVRDKRTKMITGYKNLVPLHDHLKHRVHRRTHADVEGSIPKIIGPVIHTIKPSDEYTVAQDHLLSTLDNMHEDLELKDFVFPRTKSEVSKAFSACKKLLSGEDKVSYLTGEIEKVLEENEINKVVVFSFYKHPLYLLEKTLEKKGIESSKFTGDQSAKDKQESVNKFAGDSRVLLVSNAGYKGLDLPYANYVYHIDIPLSFEVLDQRNKRVTRLSSIHSSVIINYLITDKSIESFYFKIVLKQGELLKATFDEAKDSVKIRTGTLRQYLDGYRKKT